MRQFIWTVKAGGFSPEGRYPAQATVVASTSEQAIKAAKVLWSPRVFDVAYLHRGERVDAVAARK